MYAPRTICSRHAASRRASFSTAAAAVVASTSAPVPHGHRLNLSNRRRRRILKGQSPNPQDSALTLFNDVVNSPSATPQGSEARPSEWSLSGSLKGLTGNQQLSTEEKLNQFEHDIWPHVSALKGPLPLPKHLYLAVTAFLRSISRAKIEKSESRGSAFISDVFRKLGIHELVFKADLILNICHELAHSPSEKDASDSPHRVDVQELIDLWKEISQAHRPGMDPSKGLQFMLPTPAGMELLMKNKRRNADLRRVDVKDRPFTAIHPQYAVQAAARLTPSLLATVAVLSDPKIASPHVQREAAPLLNAMSAAMNTSQLRVDAAQILLSKAKTQMRPAAMGELTAYVAEQWPHMISLLHDEKQTWAHTVAKPAKQANKVYVMNRDLRAAYQARNTGAAISVWDKVVATSQRSLQFRKDLRHAPGFLDYAVFTWCAFRRPAKLQETLALMTELELKPTIKTYTSMMHGWKVCKDIDRIEELWKQLSEAGVKFDSHIWVERISALVEAGRAQAGIQAVADMMERWKLARANDAPDTAVEPTIEIVNAMLKGLIPLDPQAANDVLDWAGREGIEPNVRTYNITLRESIKAGRPEDVHAILKIMQSQNIEPDSATFTIIIEQAIGRLKGATAEQQVQAVRQSLTDIEAAGMTPTPETYSKILYAISNLSNSANEAVDEIIAHMRRNGMTLSPHMVTILIGRRMARVADNPSRAMASVEELLREHGLTSVEHGDQTLWERVASAYALAHREDDAMRVFRELAAAGRPVTSLPVLADLVGALLSSERKADAREVVEVVVRRKRERGEDGTAEARERYWRHHLWHLVLENGLLAEREMPAELSQMLAHGR